MMIINEQTNIKKCINNNNDRIFDYNFLPQIANANNKTSYIDSMQMKGVLQNSNYDIKGDNIMDSTTLRFGQNGNNKSKKELDTRLFPGAPLMSTGKSILENPDLSSRLIFGQDTRTSKSANALSSYSADNFTPLVESLAENVQNVDHIIPTFWVRGGMSSRTVVRNIDYLKSCGMKK